MGIFLEGGIKICFVSVQFYRRRFPGRNSLLLLTTSAKGGGRLCDHVGLSVILCAGLPQK